MCISMLFCCGSHCALRQSLPKNDSCVCKIGRNKRNLPIPLFMNLITLAGSPYCALPSPGFKCVFQSHVPKLTPMHQEGPEGRLRRVTHPTVICDKRWGNREREKLLPIKQSVYFSSMLHSKTPPANSSV